MQRIKKELQELQANHEDWYRVVVGDNIFSLNVYIRPNEGPYVGGIFHLRMNIADGYPFKAPEVSFVTPIFHPGVEEGTGKLCDQFAKENWTPRTRLTQFMSVILSLLSQPGGEVNTRAATLYTENRPEFDRLAAESTAAHALKAFPE